MQVSKVENLVHTILYGCVLFPPFGWPIYFGHLYVSTTCELGFPAHASGGMGKVERLPWRRPGQDDRVKYLGERLAETGCIFEYLWCSRVARVCPEMWLEDCFTSCFMDFDWEHRWEDEHVIYVMWNCAKPWSSCGKLFVSRLHMEGQHVGVTRECQIFFSHWIGLSENLQGTMVFTIKHRAFQLKISHNPILWFRVFS